MRRALSLCFALCFALSIASVAVAQQQDDDDRRVIYRPVTSIDFGEKDVQGVIQGPNLKLIRGDDAPIFNPLVKLRSDFDPEILLSVHEL